jgi:hypothetical protein
MRTPRSRSTAELGAITRSLVGVALALALASSAAAQSDDAPTVSVTVLLIPEGGATAAHLTRVGIGLRRGLEAIERLDYEYPGAMLAHRDAPEDLFTAIDELPSLVSAIREGTAGRVQRRLTEVTAIFEQNLDLVSRTDLVTAYVASATAQCARGRRRECIEGFEHVLTFRETAEYDTSQFSEEYFELFEETRARLLSEGERGALTIVTDPAGAEVFIDGRSMGPSPARADGLLVGGHYVTVKLTGYNEYAARAEVFGGSEQRVEYTLDRAANALILEQNLPAIRRELGRERAGDAIRGIFGYLPVNQIVIGLVSQAPDGELTTALYLYDLRTQFLLAQRDAQVRPDQASDDAQRLVAELYEGVSLAGRVEAPDDDPDFEDDEIWEQWWFWTAIGAVTVGGAVTLIAITSAEPAVPPDTIRLNGLVQ